MALLTTLIQLAAIWLLAYAMGLAAVKYLLPADIEREYGALIAPTTGVLMLCLLAYTLSTTFDLGAPTAVWLSLGILAAAAAATQLRPELRIRPGAFPAQLRRCLVLVAPMAILIIWPLFYFGAQGYLGSVNPDFFAGAVDIHYLLKGHSMATFEPTMGDSFHPVEGAAGYGTASARFGSELFAIALHLLLGTDIRASLALTIGFSMLCLPLTLYAMARLAMGFDERAASITAWLIGASAPVGMSYLYSYLGQNAGLPALALVFTAAFLMLTRPRAGTVAYCALTAHALWVNYFAMLPYALAPAGPLWLYLVATRRLSLRNALLIVLGVVAISAALMYGNLRATMESVRMWMGVIGQSLQGQYFLDFLTEAFFSYFFGIYNYQASPWAVYLMGQIASRLVGFAVALACLGALIAFVRRWIRETPSRESRVFVLSALAIYVGVWALYSFSRQYGYAVFKMSSWLQFILVPFMAYGLHRVWQERRVAAQGTANRAVKAFLGVTTAIYVTLNVAANVQYSYNGLGTNRDTGYIVNHFGVSGNRDFFELEKALARHVKPGESVGMLFTDSIRNWWTAYYTQPFRQSFLSHALMPGDDENLPDIRSNVVVDYYGNVEHLRTEYFHGGMADTYYLTWNTGDLNRDIAVNEFKAKPLWENASFRLFRGDDLHDVLFTGRGFYRLEYFKPIREYFFPEVLRWSADGGEFYLLRPSRPGKPYRLSLDAIVGYEYPNDRRTLEFYVNGRKFDEQVVTNSARVVSAPFHPEGDVTKLVVHIKEKNKPLPREFALWNKEIPADYRRMNIAFSNTRIVAPEAQTAAAPARLGATIGFLPLLAMAQEFNGLQIDGWTGDLAQITLPVPREARTFEITGFAPGNLGLQFPMRMIVKVNGKETPVTLQAPGPFTLSAPIAESPPNASITLLPGQSREIGEVAIRHRVIRRSVRIDSLTFR